MSIFTTPLAQLTIADLQELLQNSAVENIRLEFKSEVPDKKETLKKISSFANTFGGFLVIGGKADSADGRLVELRGVEPQNSYKQQVVQWCFDGASPPLTVEVSDPIPHATDTGKVCYVIYTPESDAAPHFLNGRKGVWVRSDEFSQHYIPELATENEIRHLLDRRRLIQERRTDLVERSRRRFAQYRSRQVVADYERLPRSPRLEVSVGPRFPVRPLCNPTQLALAVRNSRVPWRQAGFPHNNAGLISQHESVLLLTPSDSRNRIGLVEANIWGMLFYGTEVEIELGPTQTLGLQQTPISGIHLYRFVGYLLVFMKHAKQMIERIGYEGPIRIDVSLNDILSVPWLYGQDNAIYNGPVSELDDAFSFSLSATTEELRERRDALVTSMLEKILFAMNWHDYADSLGTLEGALRAGYRYNFWDWQDD